GGLLPDGARHRVRHPAHPRHGEEEARRGPGAQGGGVGEGRRDRGLGLLHGRLPDRDPGEILRTIAFALSLPLDRVQFTKTTPLPGTDIYDYWRAHDGRGEEVDWTAFNYYAFNASWSEVSAEELARLQRWGHRRFYLRPRNFLRVVRRLRPAQYAYAARRLTNLGVFGQRAAGGA